MIGWLNTRTAAQYAGVTVLTIRNWMRDGLRYFRPSRAILIRPADLDAYIQRHLVAAHSLDDIVDEVCRALN